MHQPWCYEVVELWPGVDVCSDWDRDLDGCANGLRLAVAAAARVVVLGRSSHPLKGCGGSSLFRHVKVMVST